MAPDELAGVAVTHIHLDHAGGVGDVARAFPRATVYVHEKGARHLVDPERLVRSAGQVYGDLLDSLYGRLEPTPAERIHVLADGETVEIGPGARLTTVDSPGHAKHHLALHDSESGILFAGDAVGVRLPDAGVLRPVHPACRLRPRPGHHVAAQVPGPVSPAGVALAHYGLLPEPLDMLEEAEEILRRWAEVAETAWRAGGTSRPPSMTPSPPTSRHRPGASDEARDPQRHPLQRRRPAPLAGDHQGTPGRTPH